MKIRMIILLFLLVIICGCRSTPIQLEPGNIQPNFKIEDNWPENDKFPRSSFSTAKNALYYFGDNLFSPSRIDYLSRSIVKRLKK